MTRKEAMKGRSRTLDAWGCLPRGTTSDRVLLAVKVARTVALVSLSLLLGLTVTWAQEAQAAADPGPRPGASGAGGKFSTLDANETAFFNAARARFQEVDSVSGGITGEAGSGLGPTFNTNSCASCHAQPDVGGTSPHPTLGQVRRRNP